LELQRISKLTTSIKMALRKKNKINAEFSMSSLTDIIFLLLIFFMLTSGLVAPNALNLLLPGSSTSKIPNTSRIDNVQISETGNYAINGRSTTLEQLDIRLSRLANRDESITISPDSGTPVENVVAIMDLALKYNINGILSIEKE